MKKLLIILVVAAVVIAGIWLVLVKPAQTPSVVTPSNSPSTTAKPAISSNTAITIQNFAFSPATVTINRGTTVTWTNMDSAPHQPTSDSGSVISSQPLQSGNSYSVVFSQAGTYAYHCAIHPSMTGTIIVR